MLRMHLSPTAHGSTVDKCSAGCGPDDRGISTSFAPADLVDSARHKTNSGHNIPPRPKSRWLPFKDFLNEKKNPRPEMNSKANQTGQQFISPHWHDLAATSGLMMGGHDLPGFFNLPLDLVCLPIHATSAKLGRAPAGWLCGRLLRHTHAAS